MSIIIQKNLASSLIFTCSEEEHTQGTELWIFICKLSFQITRLTSTFVWSLSVDSILYKATELDHIRSTDDGNNERIFPWEARSLSNCLCHLLSCWFCSNTKPCSSPLMCSKTLSCCLMAKKKNRECNKTLITFDFRHPTFVFFTNANEFFSIVSIKTPDWQDLGLPTA